MVERGRDVVTLIAGLVLLATALAVLVAGDDADVPGWIAPIALVVIGLLAAGWRRPRRTVDGSRTVDGA